MCVKGQKPSPTKNYQNFRQKNIIPHITIPIKSDLMTAEEMAVTRVERADGMGRQAHYSIAILLGLDITTIHCIH